MSEQSLARIPMTLLSKEQASSLRLKEEPYLIMIPKHILSKIGINNDNLSFELTYDKGVLSLVSNFNQELATDTDRVKEVST